jgi:ADP-ribosylglycohydrolase
MRISWIEIPERIEHELKQLQEEGADVAGLVRQWEELKKLNLPASEFRNRAEGFYFKIEGGFPAARDFPHEPSSWNIAAQLCQIEAEEVPSYSPTFLKNRILGGWLGRAAGCLLGKPVEKIPRHAIKEMLLSNGTWPLTEYMTERGIPQSLLKQYPWNRHGGRESLRENIVCMTEDDDMNYPMLNLHVLETYGKKFDTDHVAQIWLAYLPVLSTFSGERVAYVNYLNGLQPPRTALHRNPYREWIGSQIRADLWGWASPAQPSCAAEFAWRDASLSHVRNGIYGEVFFAAAIADSFVRDDLREILGNALKFIPPQSRFAEAIRFVLALPVKKMSWEETVNLLYDKYGSYHWVHTINNAALVVAALLSSDNDFGRAICNAVMGGWDTDCNGATVGSIMGTMLGADKLPHQWIDPLHDRIRTSLKGFDNATFSDLARRTVRVAQFHSTADVTHRGKIRHKDSKSTKVSPRKT